MQYNTKQEKPIVPDYGRNIQKMVEHCKTIRSRKERQQCANEIVAVMEKLFPSPEENSGPSPIHWNRLAEMAQYQLDIDYPVEIVPKEKILSRPNHVEYPSQDIIYRHYGHVIQDLIHYASGLPDGEEKERLQLLIANRMKSSFLSWNRRHVTDDLIFKDLKALSGGLISLSSDKCTLQDFSAHGKETKGKKKK